MTDDVKATLALVLQLSPTDVVKMAFTDICNEMVVAKEESQFIVLQLIGAVYDGLAYGNWPGLCRKVETIEEAGRRMLKEGLEKCSEEQILTFKKLYSKEHYTILYVVSKIPTNKLGLACKQVQDMLQTKFKAG